MLQFCCKFTSVSVCQKLSKYDLFDKVIPKIKGAIFCPTVYFLKKDTYAYVVR